MKEQGSREKRIFRIVAGCILVFLLIAAVNVWRAKTRKTGSTNSEAAVPVQVFSVKTGDLDRSLEVTGDLLSLEDVFIYPKIPGKIIEKFFVEKVITWKRARSWLPLKRHRLLRSVIAHWLRWRWRRPTWMF